MKSYRRLNEHSFLLVILIALVALLSSGCSSSTASSDGQVNPLGAYQITDPAVGGTPTSGTTTNVGAIDSPIVSTPVGDTGVDGHTNSPLLDNMHPGWQQADCLSCHNDTTRNPDHNYTNAQQCYLCHGTNGLPGFGDKTPPVIQGVIANPAPNSVVISWKTDEESLSRLVLRTIEGDRLEFPVGSVYSKTHRYSVNGLISEKNYTYELICTDRNGNRTTSATFGQLSFTTLTTTTTTGGTTTTPEDVESFFSNVSFVANGSQAIKFSFTPKATARCKVFMVVDETGESAPSSGSDFNSGDPITGPHTEVIAGLTENTRYRVYVQALEDSGASYKTKIMKITTTPFGG